MSGAVLTPLDGSRFGELALPFAAEIASATAKNLHLLHVHVPDPRTRRLSLPPSRPEPGPAPLPPEVRSERRRRRRDGSERALDRFLRARRAYLAGTADRYGLDVGSATTLIDEGWGVPEAIRRHAQRVGSDLIVMSTRGRTGFGRVWLGSISDALIRAAHIPVLLVRPPVEPERVRRLRNVGRVLVPLDGTPLGERILDPVAKFGATLRWRLLLVHVVPTHVVVGARASPLKVGDIETRRRAGIDYLATTAERLRERGLSVRTRVVVAAPPARAILQVADASDVDLVAMATHGRGGLKRAVLGSVADGIIGGSSFPILLGGSRLTVQ